MLNQFLSTLHRVRCGALQTVALLGLASLAALSSAQAVVVSTGAVITGDVFSIEMFGYNNMLDNPNNGEGNIRLLFDPFNANFGTTQLYPGYALGNQPVTVSSYEVISGNMVQDFISISVPNNFVPAGTTDANGRIINAFALYIGQNNFGGADPLDFTTALTSYNVTASVTFTNDSVDTSGSIPATTTLTNGNKSLSSYAAFFSNPSTQDISA